MSEVEEELGSAAYVAEANIRQPNIWRYIASFPTWLAAFALFFMMAMTFLDVILRSTISNPIESATELTRFCMAIIVFSSLPIVSWKSGHIIVDLMDPFFGARAAKLRDILIDLICGVVLFWPAKRVWDLAERAREFGDVTEYMGVPQHYIGWFISFFAFVTAITLVIRGLLRIFAPEKVNN
jgi:TRAP-type C4-dicarboxylate transport system permease small subunit